MQEEMKDTGSFYHVYCVDFVSKCFTYIFYTTGVWIDVYLLPPQCLFAHFCCYLVVKQTDLLTTDTM